MNLRGISHATKTFEKFKRKKKGKKGYLFDAVERGVAVDLILAVGRSRPGTGLTTSSGGSLPSCSAGRAAASAVLQVVRVRRVGVRVEAAAHQGVGRRFALADEHVTLEHLFRPMRFISRLCHQR